MAYFGKRKIIKILDEYKHPDAFGEYGSVTLMQTGEALCEYSVAVDYEDDGASGRWSRAYSTGNESRARAGFLEEVEKVKERTAQEVALQRMEKTVREHFRSMFWLEISGDPNRIVLCKNYNPDAAAGKQWKWGRRQSWLPKSEESAKTIFSWEIIKLAQKAIDPQGERIFTAKKKIVEQYNYLLLVEFEDKEGGFAVFEDGIDEGVLAYFSKDEKRYARWAFESRRADVDITLERLETERQYAIKMERLKERELKVVGFTSYSGNDAIKEMVCGAEKTIAFTKTIEFMKKNGLKFSGEHHQNGDDGAVVFNNGRKYCISMRSWGGLMAEVMDIRGSYNQRDEDDEDDEDYEPMDMSYCKWAWSDYQTPVLPADKGIRVYACGEAVEEKELDKTLAEEQEVDTRPSYYELQRFFAQQGYFKMPRVLTPEQFLNEVETADKEE